MGLPARGAGPTCACAGLEVLPLPFTPSGLAEFAGALFFCVAAACFFGPALGVVFSLCFAGAGEALSGITFSVCSLLAGEAAEKAR